MNPTAFFEYDEHKPEHLAVYGKFKIDSQYCLNEISSEGYVPKSVFVTKQGECFDVLSPKELSNIQTPSLSHAKKKLEAAAAQK